MKLCEMGALLTGKEFVVELFASSVNVEAFRRLRVSKVPFW